MSDFLMNTYARMPVAFVRGHGAWLYDREDRPYLDAIAGIGVCALGHAHPEVAAAIADQAATLIHTANLARVPLQEELAERLCRLAAMDRAFITNTGAEGIECAFKIARKAGHARGIEIPRILVTDGAFHGRTLAAISASSPGKLQEGFTPEVEGFTRIPFGDAEAAEAALAADPTIAAVLVEPVQGEGGIRIPPAGYLEALRGACDRHGALLMLDEIQAGLYRTGYPLAHCIEPQSRPDVIVLAKALGNGYPVAACLARGAAAEVLTPGSHGTTFGGSPLACRAALTVLGILHRDNLARNAREVGTHLMTRLEQLLEGAPGVREIRGRGLMIGVEMDAPAEAIRNRALAEGVLINVTRERVIRLLPPLIIDQGQADRIATVVAGAIRRERAA